MTERGICMSGPMVLAIREGRKSQTRRLINPQPVLWFNDDTSEAGFTWKPRWGDGPTWSRESFIRFCPHGVPGEVLYVKEACWMWGAWRKNGVTKTGRQRWRFRPRGERVVYERPAVTVKRDGSVGWVYRHARFMPKRMARTWTEITDVRVQQVQEITIWDAIEEGVKLGMVSLDGSKLLIDSMACPPHVKYDWIGIWDSIHGPGAWERNDWVFVITFKRIQ